MQNWNDEMSELENMKDLQDLRFTFSSRQSSTQEKSMLILRDFISGHDNLKTIIVACHSLDKVTDGPSDATFSWHLPHSSRDLSFRRKEAAYSHEYLRGLRNTAT